MINRLFQIEDIIADYESEWKDIDDKPSLKEVLFTDYTKVRDKDFNILGYTFK